MNLLHTLIRQIEPTHHVYILMYHGFTDKKNFKGIENYHGKHLHIEKFEEQIRYLKNHYKIISLANLVDACAHHRVLPPRSMLLTIDDGYKSNFTLAYPLLKRYQTPATIFITTDFIDKIFLLWVDRIEYALNQTTQNHLQLTINGQFRSYDLMTVASKKFADRDIKTKLKKLVSQERDLVIEEIENKLQKKLGADSDVPEMYAPLEPSQIKEMSNSNLMTIGNHTSSHVILTACSIEQMRAELDDSKTCTEAMTNRPCKFFSYPNGEKGDFDDQSKRILKDLGFRCALTSVMGSNDIKDEVFELKRLNIHNDGNFTGFICTLSSGGRFLRRIKNANLYGD